MLLRERFTNFGFFGWPLADTALPAVGATKSV
jgi:hypothetical protein